MLPPAPLPRVHLWSHGIMLFITVAYLQLIYCYILCITYLYLSSSSNGENAAKLSHVEIYPRKMNPNFIWCWSFSLSVKKSQSFPILIFTSFWPYGGFEGTFWTKFLALALFFYLSWSFSLIRLFVDSTVCP